MSDRPGRQTRFLLHECVLNLHICVVCVGKCVFIATDVTLEAIKHIMKAQMASARADGPVCTSAFSEARMRNGVWCVCVQSEIVKFE